MVARAARCIGALCFAYLNFFDAHDADGDFDRFTAAFGAAAYRRSSCSSR
jgi:hypothetical protein